MGRKEKESVILQGNIGQQAKQAAILAQYILDITKAKRNGGIK